MLVVRINSDGKMQLSKRYNVPVLFPDQPTNPFTVDDWKLTYYRKEQRVHVTWQDQEAAVTTGGRSGLIHLQEPKSKTRPHTDDSDMTPQELIEVGFVHDSCLPKS